MFDHSVRVPLIFPELELKKGKKTELGLFERHLSNHYRNVDLNPDTVDESLLPVITNKKQVA